MKSSNPYERAINEMDRIVRLITIGLRRFGFEPKRVDHLPIDDLPKCDDIDYRTLFAHNVEVLDQQVHCYSVGLASISIVTSVHSYYLLPDVDARKVDRVCNEIVQDLLCRS